MLNNETSPASGGAFSIVAAPIVSLELGIIEGFYGPPWADADRLALARSVAGFGFGFHHYAPKADPHVRRRWRQPWPRGSAERLQVLSNGVRAAGMRFGLGISPIGLQRGMDRVAREALGRRIEQMNAIGIDDLVVMFDDEAGAFDDLAEIQVGIVHFAAEHCDATRVFCCPTYYSDDPLLDELFGPRPAGYLESIGRRLDPSVEVYWSGPMVVAEHVPVDHIRDVAARLGRKPVLWDNYPVNDSPRMIRHLHLRAFTGRPGGLTDVLSAHAINPALQPHLSAIPAATLPILYRQGDDYDPDRAFIEAARDCVGPELAKRLEADLVSLHDLGLDGIDAERRRLLRTCYAGFDQPAAREVMRWLDDGGPPGDDLAATDS